MSAKGVVDLPKTARLIQGNQAIAEGAFYAGARFYAGYPITPSSEVADIASRQIAEDGRNLHADGRRNRQHRGGYRCFLSGKKCLRRPADLDFTDAGEPGRWQSWVSAVAS